MSMELTTVIELIEVFCAYILCSYFAPYFVFHRYLKDKALSERLLICVLLGNFYMINVVFLIFALHIPGTLSLYLFTLIPVAIAWARINKPPIRRTLSLLYTAVSRLFLGEAKIKTILSLLLCQPKKWCKTAFRACLSHIIHHIIEWIMLLSLLGFNVWYYSYQTVTKYIYGASDIIVHHRWINEMDNGTIFWHGIYPFGFHNVIYFLHHFFGFQTVSLLRVFGVIETIFIYLMLYLFLRKVCRSKYIPFFGMFLFTLPDLFNFQATMRYQWSLPQEFAMLFLYPCAYFLIQFFERKKEELRTEKEFAAQKILYSWVEQYHILPSTRSLIFFAISFSLTLAVHFYITIIAVLLCIAIAIAYFPVVFHPRYFFSIALSGILSLCIAITPMGIGYASGIELEGSLGWALSVIFPSAANNSSEDATSEDTSSENTTNSDTSNNDTSSDSASNDTSSNKAATSSDTYRLAAFSVTPLLTGGNTLLKQCNALLAKAKSVGTAIYRKIFFFNGIASLFLGNVINNQKWILWFVRACEAGIAFFALTTLFGRKFYTRNMLAICIYLLFLITIISALGLNIPAIMDVARSRIFLAYAIPLFAAAIADMIYVIVCRPFRYHRFTEILPIGLTLALTVSTIAHSMVRPLNIIYALQPPGEMQCDYDIMKNYPEKKWTIVTTTNSAEVIRQKGWHMEICTFLKKMKDYNADTKVTIPTKYVFFFIEKKPLNFGAFSSVTDNLATTGAVSEKDAAKSAVYNGDTVYEAENRAILESKMYYWAKEFEQQYPKEFQVYYEDDNFICYRIVQNEYHLYNFAIDYQYN